MSGQPNFDDDADAAMHEMMGFSTFTERRKDKRFETTFAPSLSSSSSSATAAAATASQPGESSSKPASFGSSLDGSKREQNQNHGNEEAPVYAFSSPVSNTYYTREDLDAWARGKVNANGDTVYFKPGFVSDDPWARLRPREGDHDSKKAGT
ncbi:hypothetical protein PV08_11398 [Exophiala spinifera]|uniref:Uncharacterized protein n=1 Tax=Exophiala spinifera TaxID=91928 RepID=A0A0D2BGG4_9EURO|nr:uncharacterized protein PV08_11398 [Exophiala spinifera]KIW10434.1 hypothetical protein PV08_11398 [Exophiala spinifera]